MTTRKRQAPERSSKVVRALTAFARAKKGDGDAGDDKPGDDEPGDDNDTTPPRPAPPPVEEAAAPPPPRPAPPPVEEAAAPSPPRPAPPPVEEAAAPPPPRPAPPVAAAPGPAPAPASDDEHTALPDPKSVVPGDPDASEPPPRRVPRGDSRSLRRGHGPTEEFALVYRNKSFLVTRVGVVGRRGRWRAVEYPSPGSAAHAYAQECSRLVGDGFADYQG